MAQMLSRNPSSQALAALTASTTSCVMLPRYHRVPSGTWGQGHHHPQPPLSARAHALCSAHTRQNSTSAASLLFELEGDEEVVTTAAEQLPISFAMLAAPAGRLQSKLTECAVLAMKEVTSLPCGGGADYLQNFAQHLSRLGWEVWLRCCSSSNKKSGVQVHTGHTFCIVTHSNSFPMPGSVLSPLGSGRSKGSIGNIGSLVSGSNGGHVSSAPQWFIVDPNWRECFRIGGQGSEDYSRLLDLLPEVLVATAEQLAGMVDLMAVEIEKVFAAKGVPVPTWRQKATLLRRWLAIDLSHAVDTPVRSDAPLITPQHA